MGSNTLPVGAWSLLTSPFRNKGENGDIVPWTTGFSHMKSSPGLCEEGFLEWELGLEDALWARAWTVPRVRSTELAAGRSLG